MEGNHRTGVMARAGSFLGLVIANSVVIVLALWQEWDIITLAWIYWLQSILIGLNTFVRIIRLRDFKLGDMTIGNSTAQQIVDQYGKNYVRRYIAFFFLFHYGFFHVGYAIFLVSQSASVLGNALLVGVGIFAVQLFIKLIVDLRTYQDDPKRNIGTMMMFPYARIIPMHIGIVFGVFFVQSAASLMIFLFLKMIADLVMHLIEQSNNM